jgi:hypothetical protein
MPSPMLCNSLCWMELRRKSGGAIEEDELPAFNPTTNPMGDSVTAT